MPIKRHSRSALWRVWCGVLAALALSSWTTSQALTLDELGYRAARPASPVGRATAEAIDLLNHITAADPSLRLAPGWESGAGPEDIPVHVVRPDGFGPLKVAEVPNGCRCIVVGAEGFKNLLREPQGRSSMFDYEPGPVLAFILLHELGHIRHGHYGAFVDGHAVDQELLNLDETEAKAREDQADEFLVRVLRDAQADSEDFFRWMASSQLVIELWHLSWNLSVRRRVDYFGSSATGDRRVFWDVGTSHPNFEYRLLRINHKLVNSEDSAALLKEFEDARIKGREPMILYQAE